ncbi:unnamed protein product, partial [Laminaria digitata]
GGAAEFLYDSTVELSRVSYPRRTTPGSTLDGNVRTVRQCYLYTNGPCISAQSKLLSYAQNTYLSCLDNITHYNQPPPQKCARYICIRVIGCIKYQACVGVTGSYP